MVHYSCDSCGKILDSGDDTRYKVKIETYIANDIDDDEFDAESLENNEFDFGEDDENIDDELDDIDYKTFQFDLCYTCYKNYAKNPISNKILQRKRFSEN